MKKVPAGHTALYSLRFFLFVVSDNFGEIFTRIYPFALPLPRFVPLPRVAAAAPHPNPQRHGRADGGDGGALPHLPCCGFPFPQVAAPASCFPPPVSTHTYAHTPFSHSPLPTPSLTSLPSLREPASTAAAAEQQSSAVTAFCPLALTDTILCYNFLAN